MIKRIGKAIMVLLLTTPALLSMELMAQDLKKPTLEDLLPGGATYRIAENLPGLQWWGDICIKPGIDSLFAVNPKNGKETLLTTREKVNQVLGSLITPTETTATPSHKEQSTAFLQYRVPVAGQAVYAYQASCEIHRL